jgi:AcrR family transcriptional regulator
MPEASSDTRRPTSGAATKDRILAAAEQLFYAHGIRATSADRIIDEVGITKVTFYRHFSSKSALVVAYLEKQAAAERGWFASVREAGDPAAELQGLATGIGGVSCQPGFRGCAFINAAAEFADPEDPVRKTVDAHREWMLAQFSEIASSAGAADVDSAARQLMVLRDGAMVNGYLGDPAELADALQAAFASVVARG